MTRELAYTELNREFAPGDGAFSGEAGLIGQGRAEEALAFGLSVKAKGYNIYVSGRPGCGKATFSEKFAAERAKAEPPPPDLLYAYNFSEPKEPRLLRLTAGRGREFREDSKELRALLAAELPKLFSERDFEDRKAAVVKVYQQKRDERVNEIKKTARSQGFGVKFAQAGVYFMPLVDGEMLSEEAFDELPDEERDRISANSEVIQEQAVEVMREIKTFEKATRKDVEDLEYGVALKYVGRQIGRLRERYADEPDALDHLNRVKEDILDNIADFQNEPEGDGDDVAQMVPWLTRRSKEDLMEKYAVNLIVDNGGLTGAPVVVCPTPTVANVAGEIEYDNEYGNVTTDFMKIKPGALHKANGGYLILHAQDVFSQPHLWEALRKALKTGEMVIDQPREFGTGPAIVTLRPQAAPLSVKVVLTGEALYYDLLYDYDDDFQKLFKIHAEFDDEMPADAAHIQAAAGFVYRFAQAEGLPFESGAVACVLGYAARLAERQNKLSTRFGRIEELLTESAALARAANEESVSAEAVERAIAARERRLGLYEEKLSEMIDEGVILVDTSGAKTGQVNGLAVIETGDYAFAKPTRITATTYVGQAGVVNIEEEAEMSGSIHTRGVQELIGYLGQHFAQSFPLSLSCRVGFEQNYSGIDGDSASSAELYAVLSSLADAPIDQGLAVTGSMNQFGEIQPVGGVTYKIEGFFDVCRKRGLTGSQGVIIPARNVMDLTLAARVVSAVKDGAFHIYAADHVEDGIRLLTHTDPGEIHARAARRLKQYYKASQGSAGGKK